MDNIIQTLFKNLNTIDTHPMLPHLLRARGFSKAALLQADDPCIPAEIKTQIDAVVCILDVLVEIFSEKIIH